MSAPPRQDKETIRRELKARIYQWVEDLGPDSPSQSLKLSDINDLARRLAEYAEPLQENR